MFTMLIPKLKKARRIMGMLPNDYFRRWNIGDWIRKGKKFINQKIIPSATKNYKNYVSPTVGLFKKTGSALTKTGKFALKSGVLGMPGAIATGLYYGGKAIVNKGEKTASRTPFRQYNKKGKWMV